MKTKKKSIYLLIGPKGSGKSFIGLLMEEHFNIKFVRVEDWAKEIKKSRAIDDETYLKDVFNAIETGIRNELIGHDKVVFESTGLTTCFDRMFDSLSKDFNLTSIRISANNALCLHRVKTRDQSLHVNVSDHQVNHINQQVNERNLKTDFLIKNSDKSAREIVIELEQIVK